jgi:hypothetical protein
VIAGVMTLAGRRFVAVLMMTVAVIVIMIDRDPGKLVIVRLDGEMQRRAEPGDQTEQSDAERPPPLQTFAGSTHGAEPTGSRRM